MQAVRAEVLRLEVAVDAARREHVVLRVALGSLHRLHRAHLRVLDGVTDADEAADDGADDSADDGADAQGAPSPRATAAALAMLRGAETAHHRTLTRSAVQAASGPFARLLASMAAGVSAHLAVLPTAPRQQSGPTGPEGQGTP